MGTCAVVRVVLFLVAVGAATAAFGAEPADLVIAEFEGPDYGRWQATGTAFGPGPAHGTLPGQMAVSGFRGKGLVNSFLDGDDTTGTLTSPPFKIERRYIGFLIGGGGFASETCMDLLIDNKVVRTATGPNVNAGGSERLAWKSWDVSELVGKTAVLRIVDARKGGWAHINVDHIVQSEKDYGMISIERTFQIDSDYVFVPVKTGAAMQRIEVYAGAQRVRYFDVELATGAPDFWAELSVKAFRGKALSFRLKEPGDGPATLLDALTQGNRAADAQDAYKEALRPLFHFTPKRGWTNDPNGLVYFDGQYHLFFQHNPYGVKWGNMHWGHATSPDLLHWRESDDAIYPDALGTAFSGSAVVDWKNTLGVGARALVCIYTAAGDLAPEPVHFTQALAHSVDKGLTWTPYAANPVLPHIIGGNRDPKVLWHEASAQWIMALYLDGNTYSLFGSPDLKAWTRLSDVVMPECSECPDFFELPVENRAGDRKWVFWGANGSYLTGTFDGRTFTPEGPMRKLYAGGNAYAAQSYSDIPKEDGRRIQVAWLQQEMPGMPFNQQMSFPVELTLRDTGDGLRMCAKPVREIDNLRAATHAWQAKEIRQGERWTADLNGQAFDIQLDLAAHGSCTISLFGATLNYDAATDALSGAKFKAHLPRTGNIAGIRLLVDRTSLEVFSADGSLYVPTGHLQDPKAPQLSIEAKDGSITVDALHIHELKSVLPGNP